MHEGIGVLEVLRVLSAREAEVGVDQADRRQRAVLGVAEVARDVVEVVAEAWHRSGAERLANPDHRTGPGDRAAVVVLPRDVVLHERLEDGPIGRHELEAREACGQVAKRGAGHHEHPVWVGLCRRRAEPPVGHRESAGQRVQERQLGRGEVPHGDGSRLRDHEPLVELARVGRDRLGGGGAEELGPRGVPCLPRLAVELRGRGHREGLRGAARAVRVGVERASRLARSPGEPITVRGDPVDAQTPKDRVVGLVLEHHDDDVLDLRHEIGANWLLEVWAWSSRVGERCECGRGPGRDGARSGDCSQGAGSAELERLAPVDLPLVIRSWAHIGSLLGHSPRETRRRRSSPGCTPIPMGEHKGGGA